MLGIVWVKKLEIDEPELLKNLKKEFVVDTGASFVNEDANPEPNIFCDSTNCACCNDFCNNDAIY